MKKILSFILSIAAVGVITFSAGSQASAAPAVSAPQVRIQIGQRRRHARRVMVTTQTRIVHRGWMVFRETYRVAYMPYGGTRRTLISRVRIR